MFNISKTDRNLSELLRISSFIVNEICEHQFMEDATTLQLSKNQFYILKMLSNSSPFNLSDLAKILSVSNAAVGKNIDKLVQYKLVRRRFRKIDRRTAKVSITQEGQEIVENYNDLKIEKQVEVFKKFSKKDKEEFTNYLKLFVQNTLHEDMDTDILCLQCNGSCGENCIVKETKGTCLREH